MAEDVYFSASITRGEPTKVLIEGASGTQYAQTNSQPVEALTAVVMDNNNNPIANTPVVFTITQGDAYFTQSSSPNGQVINNGKSIQTTTDNFGQASSRPHMGGQSENVTIIAQADTNKNLIGQATYQIIVLKRTDNPTSFSGVAMDQTGVPIQGIQFSIARTNLTALSDENGYFNFPNNVPAGKIDLFVDGREVQIIQNGENIEYPALHFETAIIQGQNNQLPHPVYLPPVHNDRLPMVPPGTGGRFMATGWTLQPTGTRFDPPIEVHIPNTDGLKPGTTVPVVQWDHDLAYFVPMGQGTICEDGTALVTNPGSGITKAGWGGGPAAVIPNDSDDSCPVSNSKSGVDLERPIWEYSSPVGVSFFDTILGNNHFNSNPIFGITKTKYTISDDSLSCAIIDRGRFIIKGGDSITSKLYFTLNLPLTPDDGSLIPTTTIWRQIINDHEVIHAEGFQSLKEDYFNNLSRLFCSSSLCNEGIDFSKAELDRDFSIERYSQCIHSDHRGQPRSRKTPAGSMMYSVITYPVTSDNNPIEFATCEALPEPHSTNKKNKMSRPK